MNDVIYFTNLNLSPMHLGETKSQRDLRKHIEETYTEEAVKASNEMKQLFDERIKQVKDGYFGTFCDDIANKTHRYVYLKNINHNGEETKGTNIKIDLLLHTFVEVSNEV